MVHVGTGRAMHNNAPGYGDAMQRPANPSAGAPVDVRIPDGGSVHVRKIENGVVATVNDRNYNSREVHAPSAQHLRIK